MNLQFFWGTCVPFFLYVSVSFAGARLRSSSDICLRIFTGSDWNQSFYSGISLDAWASCGCLCITRGALRIVLDVFCIVCDAWASFDACASCVELGAPWVTEALLLRGIFLFFLLPCSIWHLHLLKIIYLWTSLDITLDLTRWML